jgi:uncharacterized membrane protein YkvI
MSFLHLFQLSYYFDSYSLSTFPGFWIVVGVMAVLVVASVIVKKRSGGMTYAKREMISRITGPVFVAAWLSLLWLFFRYEGIIYLSWRLWPLIIFIYLVVSAVNLWRWKKTELPKKQAKSLTGDDTKQKYLRRFQGKGK